MTKTDYNAHTEGRVVQYREAILEYLEEEGLVTKDELYDFIYNKFSSQFTQEDLGPVLNRKGKVVNVEKWRNDVDWVKAWFTRSETTYTIGDFVVLLPTDLGHIRGQGTIYNRAETIRMLVKVVQKLL